MASSKGKTLVVESESQEEIAARRERAFELEQNIKRSIVAGTAAWWACCEQVFHFHEATGWLDLNYETINEWLAQPDVEISRRLFFRMVALWRDLALGQKVPPEALAVVEPSKADQVRPAIMSGRVTVEQALSDATNLTRRDLQERYKGDDSDLGKSLAAEDEAVRIECPTCGSFVKKDQLRGEGTES